SIMIASVFVMNSCQEEKNFEKSILLYCAAGVKPVVEQVAQDYYKEYGIRIDLQYGGSGTLLSNLRVAKQGDLYLAGDKSYIDEGIKYGFIKETQTLAYMEPVIAVAKGNPKGIQSIEDLLEGNLKIGIANPDAASIGRLTKKILSKSGQWEALRKNVTVLMPTVNEVANSIKIGAIDAGIIWDATANQYSELDIIEAPVLKNHNKSITIGVLKYSKIPTEALKFLRYLSARDKGLIVFEDLGYQAINGDIWEENPQLLFFSGGVNRLAIDKTIQSFEKREGVEVARVYNGCGILVSQMKTGQKPDAYLSCDISFMTQVEDSFTDITDISKTGIVIATKKGNPKNIKNLNDLTKEGLQLGICNHKQSALGSLTKRLLESKEIWDAVYKNVRSQTPTADLLVNQIRTGSLDAVIVYQANVSQVSDKLDIVKLSDPQAMALQNFGVSIKSDHQHLMKRLLNALTDAQSKENYIENGFSWEYSNSSNNN
ncbi:MAG: extracellular solute-binding protein, partial [Bacteroidales bacterium]|nr:extracellular solute-binding protein [Bacteroidales bacterium]